MQNQTIGAVLTKIWLVPIVREIVNPIIYLLASVAFIVFLWGIVAFIRKAGEEADRSEGKRAIAYGLVGLVIIFGAYGLINFFLGAFGLPNITKVSTNSAFAPGEALSTATPAPADVVIQLTGPDVAGVFSKELTPAASASGSPDCTDTVSSAPTLDQGVAALHALALSCNLEYAADFTEYGIAQMGWHNVHTGDTYQVSLAPNEIEASSAVSSTATNDPLAIPMYGTIYLLHTHSVYAGYPLLPPSGPDIAVYCGIATDAESVSPSFASRMVFQVAAPEGLYTVDCTQFARQYVQPFEPSGSSWTQADVDRFTQTESSINANATAAINGVYSQIIALENVYAPDVDHPTTLAQKQDAVQQLMQLYSSLGVNVSLQPW